MTGLLADIHLNPAASIPIACAAGALFAWYWARLGRADVPASRRKIRRTSLVVMIVSLPAFVRGLSYLDPDINKEKYVIAWTLALALTLIVILIAVIDALNNVRLHQRQRHESLHQAASDLASSVAERRAGRGGPREGKRGSDAHVAGDREGVQR